MYVVFTEVWTRWMGLIRSACLLLDDLSIGGCGKVENMCTVSRGAFDVAVDLLTWSNGTVHFIMHGTGSRCGTAFANRERKKRCLTNVALPACLGLFCLKQRQRFFTYVLDYRGALSRFTAAHSFGRCCDYVRAREYFPTQSGPWGWF